MASVRRLPANPLAIYSFFTGGKRRVTDFPHVPGIFVRRWRRQVTVPTRPSLRAGRSRSARHEFVALVQRPAPGAHRPGARPAHRPGGAPRADREPRGAVPGRVGGRLPQGRPLRGRVRGQAAAEARQGVSASGRYIHTHFGFGYRFAPDGARTPIAPSEPLHILFTGARHVGNRLPRPPCERPPRQ